MRQPTRTRCEGRAEHARVGVVDDEVGGLRVRKHDGGEKLGADPKRCLVVEDAPMGLQAAHAAGSFTLAVVTTTPREALDADAVVDDLSAVEFVPGSDGIRVRLR